MSLKCHRRWHLESWKKIKTMQWSKNSKLLSQVLEDFNIKAQVRSYTCGPSVNTFEVVLEKGIRQSRLTVLVDDLALGLKTESIFS